MKKSLLDRWCGQPWLHATYLLGIVMLNVLIIFWGVWEVLQKLMHVFEELTWPNGFHFMMNKLMQKSDNPLAYPENRLTDMITNFGAELLFIALAFLTPVLGNKGVIFAIFFSIGETFVHTFFSFVILNYYKSNGKKRYILLV